MMNANNIYRYRLALIILSVLLGLTVLAGVWIYVSGKQAEGLLETSLSLDDQEAESLKTPDEPEDDSAPPAPLSEHAGETPLIPVHWEPRIYYDMTLERLVFITAADAELTRNFYMDEHTVNIEGITFPNRRVAVGSELARDIILEGSTLTINCRAGCLAAYVSTGMETYIQLTDPKTIYETVIVLDPGHGGDDFGAVVDRVYEKDIDLDIALRMLEIFDSETILLIPTRTDDSRIMLEDRYELANRVGDYFISVHNNIDERSAKTHGTKTYYHNHETDKPISSEELALIVQDALSVHIGARDRGIEEANAYRVLINTVIPAVITEVMFMSNTDEFARLTDPECRQEIALALCEAIKRLPPARRFAS